MNKVFTKNFISNIALGALMFLTSSLFAQTSGGPDAFGYEWRDSNDPNGPAYSWVDIVGMPGAVQVTGLADDNIRGPYPIGFDFRFYWYDVNTFRVGSNGYMGFSSTPVAHPFPTIPLPSGIQNYLAAMASDLTFTYGTQSLPVPGAECWYWTSPGNDSLVLSYIDVPFWDQVAQYTGANTFQIVLSNVDSSITYNYLLQSGVYNNPANFCTIGIENNSGNVGLQHTHDVLPPSIYSIKFYYPSNSTYQVNDASTVYNNNVTTGGLFLSANGNDYEMTAQVRNTGNQPLASFDVTSRVTNIVNQQQVISVLSTSPLAPGDTEDLVFPDVFVPTVPGVYRHYNNTGLIGDATPSNNEKILELQVVDTTQASILLSFDSGVDAGLGGLAWSGGGGGAGIEFVPPFYPCNITQLRAYIAGNTNLLGFYMMILDDDGPNGTPLTVLDSIFVPSNGVVAGAWNTVAVTAPLTITSGSFYVAWMMGGDGISIGQNQLAPISNRTYEILGMASNPNSWAAYRYREIEDLMINVYISEVPVGLNEPDSKPVIGEFYPNPANNIAIVNYTFPNKAASLTWEVYDLNGKVVMQGLADKYTSSGSIQFNVNQLPQGIYNVAINNGSERFNRKLNVIQ